MMRLILVVFLLLTRCAFVYSQEGVFTLHVAVGDTIDQQEKMNFDLFPDLKTVDFKYGIIYSSGETKQLKVYTPNDSLIVKQLDNTTIAQYQSNIEKLIAFYAATNKQDTISAPKGKILLSDPKNDVSAIKINVNKAVVEQGGYEGRRKQFLRSKAVEDRLTGEALMNAENSGCYGEIRFKKK